LAFFDDVKIVANSECEIGTIGDDEADRAEHLGAGPRQEEEGHA